MANMTNTTHAVFLPEVWSNEILDEVEANLVLANLVTRKDMDVAKAGDTVHIPTVAGLTANDKTAGNSITYEADTETEITLSIDQHKVAAFELEDITRVQADYDMRKIYTARAGYAVAKALDTELADLHSGFSQGVSAGTALEESEVITAIEFLDNADAPQTDRSFVVHPEAMADLRAIAAFTRYDATGNKGVAGGGNNGLVGNVFNIPVYMSTNVATVAGTPDVIHNLLFHKEAMALAKQYGPKTEAQYEVDDLAWKVAVQCIFGVTELRDTFAVDVELES